MNNIETDRLNLRYIITGDALFIKALFNEPAFLENTASIKVLEKLGFTYINDVFMAGYDDPSRVFSIRI